VPHTNDDLFDALARWRREGRRFVLATVVETRGFTPRGPGAKMLVGAGETHGTIGGGAIEDEVVREARGLLEGGGDSATLRRHLTRELGMCCGGEMAVFLEVMEPAPALVVFGAGHIAKPLAAVAAGCGFDVTVVDERAEWATEERFPTARLERRAPDLFAREWQTTGAEFAVVATHDHAVDQRVVQHLLERPLKFLGMIGSIPKQRKFALRLKAHGFAEQAIARLYTPLGLAIGADTPEEIAVSAVAQMIAVRRGASVAPEWLRWTSPRASVARAPAASEQP
jgi:xanthine dehydrogenase accessory factor